MVHFDKNVDTIDMLRHGDKIRFTGYIKSLKMNISYHGRDKVHKEDSYPHLGAFKIEKI